MSEQVEERDGRPASGRRRAGRQRAAVQELLGAGSSFRSAQEIYADLRERGNPIGLATVYRALQAMVEDGEVDVLRSSDDAEAVYRRCSRGHHHHLVCRRCGRTVEVEDQAVERWAGAVAHEHGFTDVAHQVEVFGTCAQCAAPSS
ncbi:Fur family transcriptional regulator [Quadrisphaera sp. DSM 44207]|uniref:Fur family transcriptional regulator n=1 Tax=Quadrisphaera sp. DSM 44207 TaxID=1881057 RepID=UPI00088F51DD|nr:Fur family transcriptional regulator [Quadrisphaera sp. DSM 44207]SDQ04634.1 zinc uptake regulator, Fur family [Quadrisphaera sp. DSM 44207]